MSLLIMEDSKQAKCLLEISLTNLSGEIAFSSSLQPDKKTTARPGYNARPSLLQYRIVFRDNPLHRATHRVKTPHVVLIDSFFNFDCTCGPKWITAIHLRYHFLAYFLPLLCSRIKAQLNHNRPFKQWR